MFNESKVVALPAGLAGKPTASGLCCSGSFTDAHGVGKHGYIMYELLVYRCKHHFYI